MVRRALSRFLERGESRALFLLLCVGRVIWKNPRAIPTRVAFNVSLAFTMVNVQLFMCQLGSSLHFSSRSRPVPLRFRQGFPHPAQRRSPRVRTPPCATASVATARRICPRLLRLRCSRKSVHSAGRFIDHRSTLETQGEGQAEPTRWVPRLGTILCVCAVRKHWRTHRLTALPCVRCRAPMPVLSCRHSAHVEHDVPLPLTRCPDT